MNLPGLNATGMHCNYYDRNGVEFVFVVGGSNERWDMRHTLLHVARVGLPAYRYCKLQ